MPTTQNDDRELLLLLRRTSDAEKEREKSEKARDMHYCIKKMQRKRMCIDCARRARWTERGWQRKAEKGSTEMTGRKRCTGCKKEDVGEMQENDCR